MGLRRVSYTIGWTAWLDIAAVGVNKATAMELRPAAAARNRRRFEVVRTTIARHGYLTPKIGSHLEGGRLPSLVPGSPGEGAAR
jgi:hypothetical protein